MSKVEHYTSFEKSLWKNYPHFKCINNLFSQQEWFAVTYTGNPVIIETCCTPIYCYAEIIHP